MANDEALNNQKPAEQFEKPNPSHIGANANRHCTNICSLVLFIAVWVGFVAFSGVAFANGDIYRLINGVDYLGNVCGRGTPSNVTNATAANWAKLQYLYYPIGFNPKTGAFQIQGAKDLGVCVETCPPGSGDASYVPTYSQNPPPSLPLKYKSWFNTVNKFHRCVPSIFDCAAALNGTANSGANSSAMKNCEANKADASGTLDKIAGYGDVALQGFEMVRDRWWVLLVCTLITIIFSFLWMAILNRAVKPMVVLTIFLVVVTVGLVAFFCLRQYTIIKATAVPDESQMNFFLGIGITAAIIEFILLCIIIYIRTEIMIACDIIEEAANVPLAIKTMMGVPPVLAIIMLGITFYFFFVAANIYTASKSITVDVPVYNSDGTFQNATFSTEQREFPNWQKWGYAFTIFQFLWTFGFINAVGFLIIAFCAVFWYWSNPGSPKVPQHGVGKAIYLTFANHLGTLALGSLIVAIIQAIRIAMAWMENRLRAMGKNSDGVRCIICCAQCCLACFEAIIKFINKNAYIVQAMTGEPFLTAARHALSLLTSNVVAVMGVTIISEYVIIFSKIILTGISVGIGYGILSGLDNTNSAGILFSLVIIGVLNYFIASVFLGVFSVCIDTVMLSYCYDLEQNNGNGRPYFFPDDLAKHLDSAKARMADKVATDRKQQFESGADYKQVDK